MEIIISILAAIAFGFYIQLVDLSHSYEEALTMVFCISLTLWIIRSKI